jgi:hypothetical protein
VCGLQVAAQTKGRRARADSELHARAGELSRLLQDASLAALCLSGGVACAGATHAPPLRHV